MALPPELNTANPASGAAPRSSGGKWAAIFVVCALVGGGAFILTRGRGAAAGEKPGGFGRGEMPPVPVVAGAAVEKDVPVYLDGLGTVQAYNSVAVRARVDGQVVKIAFTEGQEVRAGDLLAQIDPDPYRASLEQAAAKKAQDEAQLANVKADLKRYSDLLATEGITQQVYDTQKALVNQLEAAVKAGQAAIDSAKVQLAYTTVVAPIDGRVGIRLLDQGNIVRATDSNGLVVISQLKPVSVIFTLPEQTLGRIQKQSTPGAVLSVLAMDRDNTNVLAEGKLAVIDNQIDTTTGTIKLKATFPNTDLSLWPGQFVNTRLLLSVRKKSVVVPASVIQRGPEGVFVFVINADQSVEIRPVKAAQIEQGEAVIEQGLAAGERVVVDGQYKLQKGSKVKTAGSPGAGAERSGRPQKPGGATNDPGARGRAKARP